MISGYLSSIGQTGGEMMHVMIFSSLMEKIYPFYSSACIIAATFIAFFFSLSNKKNSKIFIAAISFISLIIAFYFNIRSFMARGAFSDYLFSFTIIEVIAVSIILFAAINFLVVFSINNLYRNNYVKIIIIFNLTVFIATLFIAANNFIMIFTSLALLMLAIFQLLSITNSDINLIFASEYSVKNYILRFFLVVAFAIILVFAGYSMIYGASDLKNFAQLLQSEKINISILKAGIFIIFCSVFIFHFIFPLHGGYIKLIRRCEGSSIFIIWFFYFPAVVILFLKLRNLFFDFAARNSFYFTIALLFIAFICVFAGNIGAMKTTSARRIGAFLYLAFTGMTILALAQYSSGLIEAVRVVWLIFANMILLCLGYYPLYAFFNELEKKTGKDSINNIRGILSNNKFIGINIIIILLSLAGFIGTAGFIPRFLLIQPFNELLSGSQPAINHPAGEALLYINIALSIIAWAFLAYNFLRIIFIMFKKSQFTQKVLIAKFYYAYLVFYALACLFAGFAGLFEIFNPAISITGYSFININF